MAKYTQEKQQNIRSCDSISNFQIQHLKLSQMYMEILSEKFSDLRGVFLLWTLGTKVSPDGFGK